MIFERIESPGLAHFSYLIGDRNEALVIDPRRDCDIYVERTLRRGVRLRLILETHRNEDYLTGSVELARRTGAEIWHADGHLAYEYGLAVEDGQEFFVGGLRLKAIWSPGHTAGAMSYLLYDPEGVPWMVFTGDTLLAGSVGRVDLFGGEAMANLAESLHETIFAKLLPLGDGVIVCPAHGSGSACATGTAQRSWTTIGIERRSNPRLQHTERGEFVRDVSRMLPRPPYFRQMEIRNLEGALLPNELPTPPPLPPAEFREMSGEAQVLDTRPLEGFGGGHVPGSLSLSLESLSEYGGWFLNYNLPVLLVTDPEDVSEPVRRLIRLGYDHIGGYLAGGMQAWHAQGEISRATTTMTAHDLCRRLDDGMALHVLDVRGQEELDREGRLARAQHIPLTQIPELWKSIPRDGRIAIFCGSGRRAMIAASYLEQRGLQDLIVVLGGVSAWQSTSCPIEI